MGLITFTSTFLFKSHDITVHKLCIHRKEKCKFFYSNPTHFKILYLRPGGKRTKVPLQSLFLAQFLSYHSLVEIKSTCKLSCFISHLFSIFTQHRQLGSARKELFLLPDCSPELSIII